MCCATRACPIRPISRRFPICCSSRWTRSASPRSAKPRCCPTGARWGDIKDLTGEALSAPYAKLLESCPSRAGSSARSSSRRRTKSRTRPSCSRLVGLIDSETWLGLPVDVKGEIYEGLLARNAEDVKSGAGQYFTPRALIEAMVQVVDPEPEQTVHDPGLRHGGLSARGLGAHEANPRAHDRAAYSALKNKFSGVDIVPEVVRLAAMNLYLHGITGVNSIVEAEGRAARRRRQELRRRSHQSAVRQEAELPHRRRRRRNRQRARGLRPRRFLRHHLEQAAQLPAAHHDRAGAERRSGGGDAGQRAVRGRRGRDDPAAAA